MIVHNICGAVSTVNGFMFRVSTSIIDKKNEDRKQLVYT